MVADDAVEVTRPQIVRRIVPAAAAAAALLAGLTDAGGAARLALVVVAAAALALWCRWPRVPLPLLTAAVCVPVVLAQLGGDLEPSLFLVSLLAIVLGGWAPSRVVLAGTGLIALASPWAIRAWQTGGQIDPGVWTMGVLLPGLLGVVLHRQEVLAGELVAARRRIVEQTAAEERRQAAREVHDLVGHGLAAMLLQVTSARHVLRRDLDSADDALREAEDVGRQSMRDLRRTVSLLRGAGDAPDDGPLPGLADVGSLVDTARAGGLTVEFRSAGTAGVTSPGVGLAVYRIVQESLVNAARHAPHAPTQVEIDVADAEVRLRVVSRGASTAAVSRPAGDRGYGVQGMRERAAAAGGGLTAGPGPDGWTVSGSIPTVGRQPDREPA